MGHLIVPVNIHNKPEVSHWPAPLSFCGCLKWKLLGGIHDSRFASIGRAFLPWVGVCASEYIIRNLSLPLGGLSNSPAKAVVTQQKLLDLLVKVFLDSHTALDYLLCEQGHIRCTCIDAPGEAETQLCKIREQCTG